MALVVERNKAASLAVHGPGHLLPTPSAAVFSTWCSRIFAYSRSHSSSLNSGRRAQWASIIFCLFRSLFTTSIHRSNLLPLDTWLCTAAFCCDLWHLSTHWQCKSPPAVWQPLRPMIFPPLAQPRLSRVTLLLQSDSQCAFPLMLPPYRPSQADCHAAQGSGPRADGIANCVTE